MADVVGPTNFIESNALLAVQADDVDEARRLVRDMLPGERRLLANACDVLRRLCLYVDVSGCDVPHLPQRTLGESA